MFSKITANFQSQYYQSLIHTYSSYRTEGLKNSGAFTPNLDKIFITPFVVPKNPEQVTGKLFGQSEVQENLTIWDFLSAATSELTYRRILLLGALGLGKTKLLEHITLTYAQNNQRQQNPKAPRLIPLLLSFSQIVPIIQEKQLNLPWVIRKILEQKKGVKLNVPIHWFEEKLSGGKCLVMLDGLDYLTTKEDHILVNQWLDGQMGSYEESIFIITSRPDPYKHNPISGVRFCLELQRFHSKQAEQFFQAWYLESEILRQAHKGEQAAAEIARKKSQELGIRLKKSNSLATLTTNPLFLTAIVNFEENHSPLPKNRGLFYQQIVDLLLEERDKAKGITPAEVLPSPLKKTELQYLLQVLALELMVRQTTQFSFKNGTNILNETLKTLAQDKLPGAAVLEYIETRTGLLEQVKPQVYQFAHPSWQYYLAATQVKTGRLEQLLIENIHNPWWAETILLYAGQADCTLLVLTAWKQRNIFSLTLAYDCLKETKNVELDLKEKLENWLDEALESNKPQLASFAAQVQLLRRLK